MVPGNMKAQHGRGIHHPLLFDVIFPSALATISEFLCIACSGNQRQRPSWQGHHIRHMMRRARDFSTQKRRVGKKHTHTHTQICIVFGIHTHTPTYIYIYTIYTHISTVQKDTSHSRRRSLTKSDIQTSGCKWLLLAFAWDFRQALDARLLTPTRS